MYENGKKYIIAGALGVMLGAAILWVVCGNLHDNGGAADDTGRKLDRAVDEQRRALGDIERIERGLDDSAKRADDAARAVERSEGSASAIEWAVRNAQGRIGAGERIAQDSERRIAVCRGICAEIRKNAPTH